MQYSLKAGSLRTIATLSQNPICGAASSSGVLPTPMRVKAATLTRPTTAISGKMTL